MPPFIDTLKSNSLKEGKNILKKIQTKITRKSNELQKLIHQQKTVLEKLQQDIDVEKQNQENTEASFQAAMGDIHAFQSKINDAEKKVMGIDASITQQKQDGNHLKHVERLQNVLNKLQTESLQKNKMYEDKINFFFSTNKLPSPK